MDGKQTQKLITGLEPDTRYSFLLTNRANSAGGLQHRVTVNTAPDILKSKPTLVGKTNADGMVTVQLPPVQTTAKVRYGGMEGWREIGMEGWKEIGVEV